MTREATEVPECADFNPNQTITVWFVLFGHPKRMKRLAPGGRRGTGGVLCDRLVRAPVTLRGAHPRAIAIFEQG